MYRRCRGGGIGRHTGLKIKTCPINKMNIPTRHRQSESMHSSLNQLFLATLSYILSYTPRDIME